jgi:hypothetical protein
LSWAWLISLTRIANCPNISGSVISMTYRRAGQEGRDNRRILPDRIADC